MSSSPETPALAWEIILSTFSGALERFAQWRREGKLQSDRHEAIEQSLQTRLEHFRKLAEQGAAPPTVSGVLPPQARETPSVRIFRLWLFLAEEVLAQKSQGLLTLAQSHALTEECYERMNMLKRHMIREGVAPAQTPADAAPPPARPDSGQPAGPPVAEDRPAGRSLMEILLDPRSIQWLMGLGGALMTVGLVILLWINEFFTPPVLAIIMGAANIAVLAGGWTVIRKTRYQWVGKGLTLLACLVMPLNLWYWHAQDLVTIDGHLWVAAVFVSALYAASAWTLQDETFVYVFAAGLAMTGLLILADMPPSPQKFWEIASPATLLTILGLAAIHAERIFDADDPGPFGRRRFGLAFFVSGHALLGAGLSMVLLAQLAGDWLYDPWFKPVYQSWNAAPSPICGERRWLALLLVLAGAYAYLYSDLMVRRSGRYFHAAACALLWAEVLAIQILHVELGLDAIIAVLALTSLAVNLARTQIARGRELTRSFPTFGLLLGLLPVLLGVYEYFRFLGFREVWAGEPPRWSYVGAMALTAAVSRLGAHLYRDGPRWLPTAYFFAAAASTLVAAVAALAALGLETWQEHAPILMLIPIAYLIAAKLYGERGPGEPLLRVAHAATWAMLVSSLASALAGFAHIVAGDVLNLSLSAFFAEAAAFYALAALFQRRPGYVHWATLMASGAIWQFMTYFGFSADAYLLIFAGTGLALLLAYRFAAFEQTAAAPLAEAAFMAANTLMSLAFVSSLFRGLSRLTPESLGRHIPIEWSFAGFSLAMLALALLAYLLVRIGGWRRWYLANAVALGAVTLLAVHQIVDLGFWQQVELFSVGVGLLLLVLGHLGWYREQDRQSDTVSMNLFFGSVLATAPLAVATWIDRVHDRFLIVNEAGFLFVGVTLLGLGLVFQLKATTLVGAISTALYFLTLLIFVPWGKLGTVAVLITVGGGLLFGAGLILGFFRDRLLTLPERIQKREGIFRVLNWR